MKKIFIDTNAYSRYFRGDKRVKIVIDRSRQVLISVVSLGELYFGFKLGDKLVENMKALGDFVENPKIRIIPIEEKSAFIYAGIRYGLKRKGTPIPGNDTWIAAQAIETNSTLITYDKHFLNIEGLKVWRGIRKRV